MGRPYLIRRSERQILLDFPVEIEVNVEKEDEQGAAVRDGESNVRFLQSYLVIILHLGQLESMFQRGFEFKCFQEGVNVPSTRRIKVN